MDTPAQHFEADWKREEDKLRHYFLRQGVTSTDADDYLQDTALRLWDRYRKGQIPDNVSNYAKTVARNFLFDSYRQSARRPQYESPEYFEKLSIPFADVWGREVPSTRWELAEEFSLAPFLLAETIDQREPLIRRDDQLLYYLSEGMSIREISKMFGLSIHVLQHRVTEIRKFLRQELSPSALRQFSLRQPIFPVPVQRFSIANYLRKLPGYVPEWILWFSRLTAHYTATDEPITFGVIEQLARRNLSLNEDQGKRFLLSATSERAGLLTQKFFQIMPRGEPRVLSFSDIAQLLRKEAVVVNNDWMDRIATAWEPTSKWRELADWW